MTHTEQKVIRYLPEIVCISVAVVLALAGYGTWVFIKRRRARRNAQRARVSARMSMGMGMGGKGYSTIEDPQQPIYLQNMLSRGSYGNQNYSYGH